MDDVEFDWNERQTYSASVTALQETQDELIEVIGELSKCLDYLSDECGIDCDPDIDVLRIHKARVDADEKVIKASSHFVTGTGQYIRGVHDKSKCLSQPCVVHNPSIHNMVGWPTNWYAGAMWRVCHHGIRHPDPDEINVDRAQHDNCCGCCEDPSTSDSTDTIT